MRDPEKIAAKLAEQRDRAKREMREVAANPDIAKSTIGTVVVDMIRAGEDVSTASIIAALEVIAAGASKRSGLSDVFAKGALKVISDLQR